MCASPAVDLAPTLLGALVHARAGGQHVAVRIVEVEAYEGSDDPASHAYRGPSTRNASMFGPADHLYVYQHLGLHHCVNLVCGPAGTPSAILLRAGEVVIGAGHAFSRRNAAGVCRTSRDLARGPGRLAVALGLTRVHDGVAIGGDLLTIEPPAQAPTFVTGPRVGVGKAGADPVRFPWRFYLPDDPHVSPFRAGATR